MIDLHTHSYWSDGSDSPRELVAKACALGLSGIGLCDHDTMDGLTQLEQAGADMGLSVWGGIEISCMDAQTGRPVHILGYHIPPLFRMHLDDFCLPIRRGRDKALEALIRRLAEAGYPITVEEVYALAGPGNSLCKQHIMRILIDKGFCGSLYGELYQELFKKGKNGNPPIAAFDFHAADPVMAVRLLRELGAFAVLAHPGQYDSFHLVSTLVGAGLVRDKDNH
jgi:predicted metal-dependent phosphoesterase TrpH